MTLLEFRYSLEHILFPKYFFENPLALMAALFGKEDNEEANYLFEVVSDIAKTCDFELPYTAHQYKTSWYELNGKDYLCVITLPKPKKPLLCSQLYLLFADDVSQNRYFTVELMESKFLRKKYCLCETTSDGRINHGFISGKSYKILEKVMEMILDKD